MAWIRPLRDVTLDDVGAVGGKNASLGELLRELTPLGVRVPDGFAVTADAYRAFIRGAQLDAVIDGELGRLDASSVEGLGRCSERIRSAIVRARLPRDVEDQIAEAYAAL